jgi:beta-lactam-binding protein with PASTA domain
VSVTAGHGLVETNAANNTASATLRVAPRTRCVVPKLKLTPVKVAKRVLKLLSCKPGKVGHSHSSVRKGLVIKTKPKAGTYAPGRVIKLQVSSGPKK